jgi:hypothetical protein
MQYYRLALLSMYLRTSKDILGSFKVANTAIAVRLALLRSKKCRVTCAGLDEHARPQNSTTFSMINVRDPSNPCQ